MDLNCDMGEGYGPWRMGRDEEIMPFITSANVACGAHAGDPNVMHATLRLAREHGVAVGAHPGYPDLIGFGRRNLPLDPAEVERWVLYQIGALYAIARSEGVDLSHVKPHGALYNAAAKQRPLADAIVRAVKAFSHGLPLYCPPNSQMHVAASNLGVKVIREGFADRAYEPNGSLTDRSIPGSVHASPERAAQQALQFTQGRVQCRDGSLLTIEVDSICVHSDTPGAPEIVRAVRAAFEEKGIRIAPPGSYAA
jgi:UPF0271 protein